MRKLFLPFIFAVSCFTGAAVNLSAAVGGPDSYGYTWIDSDEPGGPRFNWIEIATPAGGAGTYRSAVNCDDCHEAGIPLGFDFPFYGTNFNQVTIGSNGVVYFENVYLGLGNSCMPGTPTYTMAQYNFIALLWDDLAPNYQGGIYTYAGPGYFVIEFYDIVPCCSAGDGDTWQVILFSNGNILMQYNELSNQGVQNDYTVGIQNNPTMGLQYFCEGSGQHPVNGRSVLFSPPTFSCTSISQDILPSVASICDGSPIVLSSGGSAIASTWSTAETTLTISVSTSGAYSAIVLDTNGCTLLDTTNVMIGTPPVVNLGTDVEQCGGNVLLDAGNAGFDYGWNDASNSQTLEVTASGEYSVQVTDPSSGCSEFDTVNVLIHTVPVVGLSLITDTFCINEPQVALTGGSPALGTYSGTGVNAGDFNPANAGTGTHLITYIYADGNGCSDTATQSIVVLGCLGLENNSQADLRIYPNPTNGIIYIQQTSGEMVKAEVLDLSGKVVLSQIMNTGITSLDLSAYKNGTYIIQLTGEKDTRVFRVVLDK